jgi:ABC-type uncharacterized transport system involved in gliding motility auxiliary subunit
VELNMLLGQILGSVGIVLVLSTVLTFIIAGHGALIYIKLGLGFAFLAYYFATNRDNAKRSMGSRSTAMWAISGATIAVFFVAIAALNFIAFKNPKEWDVTRDGIFTLTDQTTKTLQGLKEEVTAHVFYRSDEAPYRGAKETLERYQSFSDKLKIEFVDPSANPELVEKFQIREGGSRVVLTASGAHEARPKDLTEQELTNALIKVTASSAKKIYFLAGHGETDINDTSEKGGSEAVTALRNDGYTVEAFSLAGAGEMGGQVDLNAAQAPTEPKIPSDAAAIVILAPKVALAPAEVEALSKWAQKGGRLFIGLEARRETGLEKLASAWHILPNNDVVVDRNQVTQMMGLPATMALVQQFDEHPITKDFRAPIALPGTRSLDVKDTTPGAISGVSAKPLARTGKTAWGETDFSSNQASFDPSKDLQPPLVLAAIATKAVSDADKVSAEGRVIVMGDGEFVSNRYFAFQANGDFFVNSLNFLGDEEGKISIRPKARGASRIFLTETESNVIKFFSIDILPVTVLALGVAVRGVRRRK